MIEWLTSRPVVIGFAVVGGALSVVAMLLRNQQRTALARQFDVAGYVTMGFSMLLFIVAGFRGQS